MVLVASGVLGSSDLDSSTRERRSPGDGQLHRTGGCDGRFARVLRNQGHGRIVVLSSVAGYRVRAANLVYGAAKAGLDGFALGSATLWPAVA